MTADERRAKVREIIDFHDDINEALDRLDILQHKDSASHDGQ